MRMLLAFPALAVVIVFYNILGASGSMIEPESLFFDTVLPSGTEIFFKVGDLFVLGGLLALFFEILKAARLAPAIILDHILSTAVFIVALVEFLLVGFCGTVTFLVLTVMALIDAVAGFSVSILSARRDYSVHRDGGL